MLILQNLFYTHPNKELLFNNLQLVLHPKDKVVLIGNNGVGKSTLFKIITKQLAVTKGRLEVSTKPYYIPQTFGQYNHLRVSEALGVDAKLQVLSNILKGSLAEEDYSILNDDWSIEDRCYESLKQWQLTEVNLQQSMGSLSGGQKTKVFLAGIFIHQPEFILMDEPSNHLDSDSREQLYNFIQTTTSSLLVISHDRKLLNLLDKVFELSPQGITVYGGNYDFYKAQKQLQLNALLQEVNSKENALKKAKAKETEAIERQQKLDARAKKNIDKAGLPKIVANTWKNNAENSSAKMKSVHVDKTSGLSRDLHELRSHLADTDQMKFGFEKSSLHKGKILIKAENINWTYKEKMLWKHNLNFQINSGERIAISGANASGKTSLIKIILKELEPKIGDIYRAENTSVYIDQEYSIINLDLNVYEQAETFNTNALLEHEVKQLLNRFLFPKEDWGKACNSLSGGERMRLMLCCLSINNKAPDMIVLDESTNNLDLQNIEILSAAINEYQGSLVVVSHDTYFLEQIGIEKWIAL